MPFVLTPRQQSNTMLFTNNETEVEEEENMLKTQARQLAVGMMNETLVCVRKVI